MNGLVGWAPRGTCQGTPPARHPKTECPGACWFLTEERQWQNWATIHPQHSDMEATRAGALLETLTKGKGGEGKGERGEGYLGVDSSPSANEQHNGGKQPRIDG